MCRVQSPSENVAAYASIGKLRIYRYMNMYLFLLLYLLSFSLAFELPPRRYSWILASPPRHPAGPWSPAALVAARASSSSAGSFLKWQSFMQTQHDTRSICAYKIVYIHVLCSVLGKMDSFLGRRKVKEVNFHYTRKARKRSSYLITSLIPSLAHSRSPSHTHVAPIPNYYEPVSVMTPVTFPLGFLAMQV